MAATRAGFILLAAGALLGCARSGLGLYLDEEQSGAGFGGRATANGGAGGSGASAGTGAVGGSSAFGGSASVGGSSGLGGSSGAGTGGRAGAGTGGLGGRLVDPDLEVPTPRLPENGRATGSVWSERARRPRFVWDPFSDATYELEVDDSCVATAFQNCDFPSPEWTERDLDTSDIMPPFALPVDETAPVGRRYFWRVRSCTRRACSPWSPVRYVDVGRQKSDFDGDGYADVVLANTGNSAPRHGRVFVGFGPLPSARSVVLEEAPMPEFQDFFGQVAEPLGDYDADGFADLLVTDSLESRSGGRAIVFFGNASFGDQRESLRVLDGEEPFGSAIPAGDVDADGQQDFVAGDRTTRLFRGASRGVTASVLPLLRTGEAVLQLSAGDVTGDGYSDLFAASVLLGDPTYPTRHDFLRGGPDGLGDAWTLLEGEGFPVDSFTILSDVNGDGFRDLGLASNAWSDPTENHIEVSYGADPPVIDGTVTFTGGTGAETGELAGPIAAGDVNGDGFDDALVGVAWHTSSLVEVNLYLGGSGSRSAPDAVYALGGGPIIAFVSTGIPRAPGDVNGDGFDDVFVSEDYANTGALFFGGPELDRTPDDQIQLLFQ